MQPTGASAGAGADGRRLVRRLTGVWLATVGVLLVLFGVFAVADIAVFGDPRPELETGSVAAAAGGAALLVVDAVVPVPASVVMVALGAGFGVLAGAGVSILGSLGALALGVGLGRRGRRPLHRLLGADGAGLGRLVDRYGLLAVVVSRPVPLVAESVALMAGAAGMAWPRVLAAGAAGILPIAVVYAVAGARGTQASGLAVAAVLVALGGVALVITPLRARRRPPCPREG